MTQYSADPGPRDYRTRAERREELLDAAALVVRDEGVAGLSTRAVAARAGVAHGVVHYVFGARRNLTEALLERQTRTVLPVVLRAADEHDDLHGALSAAVRTYLGMLRREPERFRMLEALGASGFDGRGDTELLAGERRRWHEAVVAGIEHWLARHGQRTTVPVAVLADAVIALVDGLARAAWGDPDGSATDAAAALLVDAVAWAASSPVDPGTGGP